MGSTPAQLWTAFKYAMLLSADVEDDSADSQDAGLSTNSCSGHEQFRTDRRTWLTPCSCSFPRYGEGLQMVTEKRRDL